MIEKLKVQLLSDNARVPEKKSEQAAGYDLYSATSEVIPAQTAKAIPTDVAIQLPANTYGRIAERSGLAVNQMITIGGGVIDADFRGGIRVIMINNNKNEFLVGKHQRIAQLVIEKIQETEIEIVKNLNQTTRGQKGLGSTGLN